MNLNRREFVQLAMVLSGGLWTNPKNFLRAMESKNLYEFKGVGNLTLLWLGDCHGHLTPNYYREAENNVGVGKAKGQIPHITGKRLLEHYKIQPGTPEAYMFSNVGFEELAKEFGPIGGHAYIAHLVEQIRAERPDRTLLMDSGDALQGTAVALWEKGANAVEVMNAMGFDMMTGHWEFTLGKEVLQQRIKEMKFDFLAQNCFDVDWGDPIFKPYSIREVNGLKVGILGQAFPYVPIAHPKYLSEGQSFGLREIEAQRHVDHLRDIGKCDLVVLLSHNGADVDKEFASRVKGIDVILGGHTHDVYIQPVQVGDTILAQAGAHGKFLGRLDLDVSDKRIKNWRYKVYPILTNRLKPEPKIEKLISDFRAPYSKKLSEEICRVETTLYRRDNFWGSLDQFLMMAIEEAYSPDIIFSPGFRWGATVPAGNIMTAEDIYAATAITYPKVYTFGLTGMQIKTILEDIADNLFNADPFYQQGGDMVRTKGISYVFDLRQTIGNRIQDLMVRGKPINPNKLYRIGNWGGQMYKAGVDAHDPDKAIYDLAIEYGKSQGEVNIPLEPNVHFIT